jgi:hypothetical protein
MAILPTHRLCAMSDEWRVEVELGDEQHHLTLRERLHSLDLDDQAQERLGGRVVVTRDGDHVFLYAGSEQEAKEAGRVAREIASAEGLTAEVSLSRWHPVEQAWKDASVPLPVSEGDAAAEEERHEVTAERAAEAGGEYDWELRVDLPSVGQTQELAGRLADEGLPVRRRWRHLLVGAATEEQAAELGKRLEGEAPDGSEVHIEPGGGVRHPVFVFIGAHKPGIARDLGL